MSKYMIKYSGRQNYSARSAKVVHLLRAITTVPDKIERSSFFLFERPWQLLYIQSVTLKQLYNFFGYLQLN
jgi:hypothetical protein